MSYAYLFKYIIIGDTGKSIYSKMMWLGKRKTRNHELKSILPPTHSIRVHCYPKIDTLGLTMIFLQVSVNHVSYYNLQTRDFNLFTTWQSVSDPLIEFIFPFIDTSLGVYLRIGLKEWNLVPEWSL